jgi:IS605 OrfB family transposase
MQLRYRFRLYPTPGHRVALARAFGCARVVFNDGLRARQAAFDEGLPYITNAELSARLTAVKASPERALLGEVSFAQRILSRKQKGSKNRDKARIRFARAHARAADRRREFHHQLSTALIRENQAIAVEDLAVKALARTRMARSVHDAAWSAFVHMLEYKAQLYGRRFYRIGRFEPTSQMCSTCGARGGPKPLHIRTWQCRECGA